MSKCGGEIGQPALVLAAGDDVDERLLQELRDRPAASSHTAARVMPSRTVCNGGVLSASPRTRKMFSPLTLHLVPRPGLTGGAADG